MSMRRRERETATHAAYQLLLRERNSKAHGAPVQSTRARKRRSRNAGFVSASEIAKFAECRFSQRELDFQVGVTAVERARRFAASEHKTRRTKKHSHGTLTCGRGQAPESMGGARSSYQSEERRERTVVATLGLCCEAP